MSTREGIICTLRPDGTTLWLPEILASSLGLAEHARLTPGQYEHAEIQGLIARRFSAEGKGGK